MSNKDLQYKLSLQDLFTGKMAKAVSETKRMDAKINGIGSKLKKLALSVGVGLGVQEIVQTTARFKSLENAIKTASGSSQQGAANLQFLNDQVNRLGLDLNAAYNGYKTFSGALMGSALAGDQANTIFRQLSEAATVMGLSGEQTEGAFLALGQMISKGKVQAEELRGQLGERIPGAFQIAAKAMGMTTAQLDKFMADGKLIAEDFLPKFGAQLEKQFGQKAAEASNSLQSNLNRMNAEWERLKVTLGQTLLPVITAVTKAMAGLFGFIRDNIGLVKILITLIGSYVLKTKIGAISSYQFAVAQRAMAMGMSKSSIAATFLSRGIRGIGAAIKAVPIIGWIAALIEGIQYLWDTFSGFREAVYGFVESIKQIGDTLVLTFKGLWNVMKGTISGDAKMMKEGMIQIAQAGALQLTAANRGIQKGKDSFAASQGIGAGMEQFGTSDKLGGKSGAGGASPSGASGGVGGRAEISSAKPQNIIINVDKLVNDLSVNTTNMTESAGKVKEMISKALLEALNDANNMAKA